MLSKGRIMLVEDEPLVAMVAADALRDLGFGVEEVTTVQAARAQAKTNIANLTGVIIDIGLPDGKGDELAVELKKLRPDLPVIIATGHGNKTINGPLKKAPRLTLLTKPYDSDALWKSLADVGLS
jgi:DNA-binding NtrC family response regulator